MFRNATIVSGYPIRSRRDEMGIEMPLSMMIELGNTCWAATFRDIVVLKGITSGFAQIAATATTVMWHFVIAKDGGGMSYNELASYGTRLKGTDHSLLEGKRHFIGLWTTAARVIPRAPNDLPNAVDRGATLPVKNSLFLKSISIGVSNIVSMAGNFERGRKDESVHFGHSLHTYDMILDHVPDLLMLFYDTTDRRAWLLDGLDGLTYLARA